MAISAGSTYGGNAANEYYFDADDGGQDVLGIFMKLNLGCGPKRMHMKGYVNVDVLSDADMVMNVATQNWGWGSGTVEYIRADNLLEHLNNAEFLHVMNEAHRVLAANGMFWFRVPNALSWPDGAFGDPTHQRYFVPRSFYYLDHEHDQWKNYGCYYGFKPWVVNVGGTERFFEATCKAIK